MKIRFPPIVGVILPFFGFVTIPCDSDGYLVDEERLRSHEADFLVIEWLGIGMTILRVDLRKRVTKLTCD